MTASPRISFGIIVLNGEPFTRYTLRALYPFAYEIIVVEGAVQDAEGIATPDGHSRDTTLETLQRFKAEEDPGNKVQLITREGFWTEKDAMSQAYAERATGDYLWQVDVDEFYRPQDMQAVIDMLCADPTITAVSFPVRFFWGAPDVVVDSWYLRRGGNIFHRLFKWGEGYRYVTHRPPTVHTPEGIDTRAHNHMTSDEMAQRGIYLYHYALLFPKQVREKTDYYSRASWAASQAMRTWAEDDYFQLKNPFRVFNVYRYPGWLERYRGDHPPQAQAMWDDVTAGKLAIEKRPMDDAYRLLDSRWYRVRSVIVKYADYGARMGLWLRRVLRKPYVWVAQIRHRLLVKLGLRSG